MERNGSISYDEHDENTLDHGDSKLKALYDHLSMLRDEWVNIPDLNPNKILINEKTIYAVDQAMNVVLTDRVGRILYGNQNIFDLTQYQPEELLGKHTRIFNARYHPKEFFKEMWDTILAGEIWRGDLKNKKKDGSTIWVRMIITPLLDESRKPFQFLALKEDITEKKEIEFRLAQKDKQLSALTNQSYDIIGIIDKEGVITYQNPAFERTLGYPSTDTIDSNISDYFADKDQDFDSIMQQILAHPHEPIRKQIKFINKDGSVRWCDVAFTDYLDDPYIRGIVCNLRDMTKQKEANDLIYHLANYDYLTNLPNRRAFETQLQDALLRAKASNGRMALLFLDLDGFKNINDTLGHEIGDQLLKVVAKRITSICHDYAIFGRLGGDEFSILLPKIDSAKQVQMFADRLIKSFSTPFSVAEYELNVSASVGICLYPQGGEDRKTLLKNADIAMYQSKNHGKNQYRMYDHSMAQNSYKAFLVKNDLTKALEKDQFYMVYQPRIEPLSKKIVGAEALIRWSHPELGALSHLEFIHFAEESGFIIPLGEWILRNVCTQVRKWQMQGLSRIKVSVNISVTQLIHVHFIKSVERILKETGLDPKWLEFEITESVLFHKEESVIKSLKGIKQLGITLALDNFGTGYSFLNYVSKHNFDVIKMDRHIIDDIETNNESYEVIMAIVKLAQKLNKHVVAGGIETDNQLELITKMGFDESQGFLFSKPVEKSLFEKLLR